MIINTEIREVQIYRRGCSAVRRGTVRLEAGDNKVQIAGLSASSYTNTLRLSFPEAVSASAVHILSPDHTGKESEQIGEQIADIEAAVEALHRQGDMWENSGGFAKLQNADIEQMEAYISAYPSRMKAINTEIRRLEKEKKELREKLNKVFNQENRPLVSAILHVENAGEYPFEMCYQDYAASWDSRYEIHTDGKGPLVLKARAEVRQNTNEDWKNVRVVLRTGKPVTSASLPELEPVWLDYEKPYPKMKAARSVNAPVMMSMSMKDYSMGAMEEAVEDTAKLVPTAMSGAEVSEADTMTEYVLGSSYNISSGVEGMYVDLQTFELQADYVIKAVPKKDIHAWLLAEIKTADLPMAVKGNASVYLNSAYTGSAVISPDYNEDTFTIALGTEERISLSRTEKKKKASEALLRNQQSAVYEFDIQAVNSKDDTVTISIQDQIPVSRQDSITVKVIGLSNAEYDEKNGSLKWKVELNPHEMKTLHAEYSISWPKDKTIEISSD